MSIACDKSLTSNLTIISKSMLQDPDISFKAKAIFAFLISLPEDNDFEPRDLTKVTKDSYNSIMSGFNELVENGYLQKVKNKNRIDYIILKN